MPIIGYGTYQTPPSITERCVRDALKVGYRSIDTAQCYGNEHEVGLACRKSGIPREDLFITTKLWACHGYADTLRSIDGSLRKLDLDYIDLLLIHEPTGDVHEIYRAMETAYRDGKLRTIGISNFMPERYPPAPDAGGLLHPRRLYSPRRRLHDRAGPAGFAGDPAGGGL